MASPKPNNVSVVLRDFQGYETAVTAKAVFGGGDTVTGINAAIGAWLTLLNNVTGAHISACRYEMEIAIPVGVAGKAAVVGAFRDVGLNLGFPNVVNDDPYTLHIAAIDPALVLSGGPDNAEGASIDLLMDYMENGAAGTTPMAGSTGGFWVNNSDSNLSPTGTATESTHKHRRSLQNGSKRSGF